MTLSIIWLILIIETVADEMVDQIGESYTQTLYEQMKRNIGQ